MNLIWLTSALLALFLASPINSSGQQPLGERAEFETIKAKAEKGDAQAQLSLGVIYASGNGVAKDLRKSAKWLHKAADQGLPLAQYQLARDYAGGQGVKPDKVEAAKWYRRAGDQGLAEAQFALGQCYANGEGVSEDVVEAVKWYRLAARQNLMEALGELGECFLEGTGVTTDVAEGIKWARQAAELGYAPAQNRLGLCYLNGQGVAKDMVQAYKWFNLGSAQGGMLAPDIKVNLAKAESRMTPEQIAEAQQLALDFRPHPPSAEDTSKVAGEQSGTGSNRDSRAPGASAAGALTVDAQDLTSEVYVDGSFVGNPPAKLHLLEGSHVVEVKAPGFRDYSKEIKIANGSELNLHVTLEKQ